VRRRDDERAAQNNGDRTQTSLIAARWRFVNHATTCFLRSALLWEGQASCELVVPLTCARRPRANWLQTRPSCSSPAAGLGRRQCAWHIAHDKLRTAPRKRFQLVEIVLRIYLLQSRAARERSGHIASPGSPDPCPARPTRPPLIPEGQEGREGVGFLIAAIDGPSGTRVLAREGADSLGQAILDARSVIRLEGSNC
jgi:hypothetical protein